MIKYSKENYMWKTLPEIIWKNSASVYLENQFDS